MTLSELEDILNALRGGQGRYQFHLGEGEYVRCTAHPYKTFYVGTIAYVGEMYASPVVVFQKVEENLGRCVDVMGDWLRSWIPDPSPALVRVFEGLLV